MVKEMTCESFVAEKRNEASESLVFGKANHLLGVEDGHQSVVSALSARADGD